MIPSHTYSQRILLMFVVVLGVILLLLINERGLGSPPTTITQDLLDETRYDIPVTSSGYQTSPIKLVDDSDVTFNISAIRTESPDLSANLPTRFLPGYRNFCWRPIQQSRLWCLPRVYLAGMPKCGSTDLFDKIIWHHDVIAPMKENQYWALYRVGITDRMLGKGANRTMTFPHYLGLFDKEIAKQSVLIDGSQSLMWHLIAWKARYPWATEPPFTNADLIYSVTPDAQIIAILREPVSRLYSDYLYFASKLEPPRNASNFHDNVVSEITRFNTCLETHSRHYCCHDIRLKVVQKVRLSVGVYICYIREWRERFGDNLMVIPLESYSAAPVKYLMRVFAFLGVSLPDEVDLQAFIDNSRDEKTRKPSDVKKGDMHDETRFLLQEFYRPYNRELAAYLGDDRFAYDSRMADSDEVCVGAMDALYTCLTMNGNDDSKCVEFIAKLGECCTKNGSTTGVCQTN